MTQQRQGISPASAQEADAPPTADDIRKRIELASEGVRCWSEALAYWLGDGLTPEAMGQREKRICEATRMLLAFGGDLYFHSTALEITTGELREQAWNPEMAREVLELFSRACNYPYQDEKRRARVSQRGGSLQKHIGLWCKGLQVPEQHVELVG